MAERRGYDPRDRVLSDIAALEVQAAEAADPAERKRLQCEAEAVRSALEENRGR